MELHFDLIQFQGMMDIEQFYSRYHGCIRVNMPWTRLLKERPLVRTKLMSRRDLVFIPNYWEKHPSDVKDDCVVSWKDGRRTRFVCGSGVAVARVPALEVCRRPLKLKKKVQHAPLEYFVLDGFHRLSGVEPAMVILDFISVGYNLAKQFTDMHNEEWRPWVAR